MSEIKKEIMKLIKSRLSSSSFILLPNLYRSQNDLLKIIWLTFSIILLCQYLYYILYTIYLLDKHTINIFYCKFFIYFFMLETFN